MSVSKGIFVYKANDKKKVKSPKKEEISSSIRKDSNDAFHEVWGKVQADLDSLINTAHQDLYDELTEFCEVHKHSSAYLPTAAVNIGVNMPDHHSFFNQLISHLRDKISPHIALLISKETANIKHVIQHMIRQVIAPEDGESISLDDCNIDYLSLWYQSLHEEQVRESDQEDPWFKKPILIVIEDLDTFNNEVFEELIVILNGVQRTIPILLICGVTTSAYWSALKLPCKALAYANLYMFKSTPAIKVLNEVFESIILNPDIPFRIGSKVSDSLTEYFLFHNFSTSSFMSAYKFCMAEHYYSNPLSYICRSKSICKKTINSMPSNELDKFRRSPSFMKYVESQEKDEQKLLLLDDDHFRKNMKQLFKVFRHHYQNFMAVLRALSALKKETSDYNADRQLRDSYALSFKDEFMDSELFKRLWNNFSSLGKEEFTENITQFMKAVEDYGYIKDPKMSKLIQVLCKALNSFDKNDVILEEDVAMRKNAHLIFKNSTDKAEREKQTKFLLERTKPSNNYVEIREKCLSKMEKLIKEFLKSPLQFTFHEVFVFDETSIIKKHFVATPRTCVHRALSNPAYYFKCKCCKLDDETDIISSLPDVCICYKLMTECGQHINLFDWLQAFTTIVSTEESTGAPNSEIQARFIQGVSELEFLGFIKPTLRKTDHMQRLTWN